MKILNLSTSLAFFLTGCATHEQVSIEHKQGATIIHHRSLNGTKAVDRIEAVSKTGVLSQAVIEVYDVGRLPDGHGGMAEAHRYYRMAQTPGFDLRVPRKSGTTGTGVRTVYTPPNYSPPPTSQRLNDALTEADKAKAKLIQAKQELEAKDNVLQGQLQTQIDENQQLHDQLNAAMATPQHTTPPTSAAAKAAASDMDQLATWANQQ